jgi:hypothetical protein
MVLTLLHSTLVDWKDHASRRMRSLEKCDMDGTALAASLGHLCGAAAAAWSIVAHALAGAMRSIDSDGDEEACRRQELAAVDCAMDALLLPVVLASQLATVAAAGQGSSAAAGAAAQAAGDEEAKQGRLGEFRAVWAGLLGALGSLAERSFALQRGQASALARQLCEAVEKVHVNALGLAALQLAALCAASLVPQVLPLSVTLAALR